MKNIWHPGESPETNGVPQLKPLRALSCSGLAFLAHNFWMHMGACCCEWGQNLKLHSWVCILSILCRRVSCGNLIWMNGYVQVQVVWVKWILLISQLKVC